MQFLICCSVFLFIIGIWNLLIAILGKFPKFLSTSVATLESISTVRNVHGGRIRFIPVSTKYVYVYKVNGKAYKYRTEKEQRRSRNMYQRVPMVYVKWFPRRAYPHKFSATAEWVSGIGFVLYGVLFLVLALYSF